MKAYKVFNPDFTCLGFQYEVGKTYKHHGKVVPCSSGFHSCAKLSDCFSYYSFDHNNKVAEVEAFGEVKTDGDKICSEKIKIVREISWSEALEICNSGDSNSGNRNSGNSNSGHGNSGDSNSGNRNSGNWNSGHSNSGDRNSGNWSSGNSNSGNRNSGHGNSGYSNSGDSNSGNWNSGDCNSGNWNSGFLNSKDQEKIMIFNRESTIEEWNNSTKPEFLFFDTALFVRSETMTDEEKSKNPHHKTTGGYNKVLGYKEAFQKSFESATEQDIELLKKLPNFDADVFFEISGIRIK